MLQRYSAIARLILMYGLSRAHNFSNKNSKKGGAVIYRPSLSLFKQLAVNIHGVVVESYLSMKKDCTSESRTKSCLVMPSAENLGRKARLQKVCLYLSCP